MKKFKNRTYLGQVRFLRKLALSAINEYPVDLKKLWFINHGENTTFKVEAADNRAYLLRIHRSDYHTSPAINEELSWLEMLKNSGFSVPQPIVSRNGSMLEEIRHNDFVRRCSMLKWVEGRFINKSISPEHLFLAGKLLAGFHNATPGAFCKHRNYWDAEGLAGYKPTFGSYDRLKNIAPAEQKLISMAGRTIYAKLKAYENKFPEKMGLIHADLHFGNVLQGKGNLRAIDFDDCGLGFHVYDLVIPYMGALGIMDNEKKNKSDLYFEALIKGYETSRVFSKEDETLFHYLFACRKILMLGWLNSRSDNPRLCAMLPIRAKAAVEHIQKNSHLFKVLKWSI